MNMLRAKRLTRIQITALICLIALSAILSSSCSAEIKARGKVLPYKVAKEQVFSNDQIKTIDLYLVSYTADIEQLQFVAQDLIIKKTKNNDKVQGITVGFYQNGPITKNTGPTASMAWVREEPTFWNKVGLASKSPFDSGHWQWTVTDPDGLNPSIIAESVKFDAKTSTIVLAGRTGKRAKSVTAFVLAPGLVTVSDPIRGSLPDNDNAFTLKWKQPAGFRPVKGDYVIRISAEGARGPVSELMVKIDLLAKTWKPPASVLIY